MSLFFHLLGSSSAGNCGLGISPEVKFLIDAGFSARKTDQLLSPLGLTIKDVDVVFITHEHDDHISGIKGLAKIPHIQFFAHPETARAVEEKLGIRINWAFFDSLDSFIYKDLEITPFETPHDAVAPVGYIFKEWKQSQKKLGWLTDLGHVPDSFTALLRDVHTLVLEANHDVEMLKNDPWRPYYIKERILGDYGHLSNEASFEFLDGMCDPAWENVILAHVSRQCNSMSIIQKTFSRLDLEKRSFSLHVSDPKDHSVLNLSSCLF
jgi:phosphoribosyl 1,2-cyclic phosphodiesterase